MDRPRDPKTGRWLPAGAAKPKSSKKKKGKAAASNPPAVIVKKKPNHLLPVAQFLGGGGVGAGLSLGVRIALEKLGDATGTEGETSTATKVAPYAGYMVAGVSALAAWMAKGRVRAIWWRMMVGSAVGGLGAGLTYTLNKWWLAKQVTAVGDQAAALAASGDLTAIADEAAQAAASGVQGLGAMRGRQAQAGLGAAGGRRSIRELDQQLGNGIRLAGLQLVPAGAQPQSPAVNPAMGRLGVSTLPQLRAGGTRLGSLSTLPVGGRDRWPSQVSYARRRAFPGNRA